MIPSLIPTVTKKQQGHVGQNLFVETDGGANRVQPNGRLPNSRPQKLPDPLPPIQKSNQNKLERYQTTEEKAVFLVKETGIDLVLAREYLALNNWNLEKALVGYKQILAEEAERARRNDSEKNRKTLSQTGRGFSVSNMQLLDNVRNDIITERHESTFEEFEKFSGSARSNFILPDINLVDAELGDYIRSDLLSISTLQSLVAAGRLNWWAEVGACRKLFPMSTKGDGNCLLHAASLGMWGFHDRPLTLRNALHKLFLHPQASRSLRRRWKYRLWRENMTCGGLNYTINEWDHEWNIVVNLASDRPRKFEGGEHSRRVSRSLSYKTASGISKLPDMKEGESLDSLESIHVYALSVLLCRPIIVVAEDMLKDSSGNPIAPIPFGGIYLPFERKPIDCLKYPLVLAYNSAHFSALVPADGEIYYKREQLSNAVPLYDQLLCLLPLRFAIDPGSNWDLVQDDGFREEKAALTYEEKIFFLRQYLDLVRVTMKIKTPAKQPINTSKQPSPSVESAVANIHDMFIGQPTDELLAAKLNTKELPKCYNDMVKNYIASSRKILKERSLTKVRQCSVPQCTNPVDSNSNNPRCLQCSKDTNSQGLPKVGSPKQNMGNQISPPISPGGPNSTKSPGMLRKKAPNEPNKNSASEFLANQVNTMSLTQKTVSSSMQPRSNQPTGNVSVSMTGEKVRNKHTFVDQHVAQVDLRDTENGNIANKNKMPTEDYQFIVGKRCIAPGCKFYGSQETKGYCSSCFRQHGNKQKGENF